MSRYTDAVECFDKALAINPQSVEVLNNKGVTLSMRGLYKDAITCFDLAIAADPTSLEALNGKAIALQHMFSYKEALDVLEELAQTDLDESPRVEMFRWLLHHFEANTMAGWDLHTDLMRIAISIVRTEDEKKRIQTNLEQIKPNGKDRDYAYQTVQKLKLQLIHQTEDEAAAIHFMEANVDNPDIQKHLIVDYMPDHIGRNHYQMACKYIRRMAKLGYKPMALELIEQLRTQYRNRRALLEELTGIF